MRSTGELLLGLLLLLVGFAVSTTPAAASDTPARGFHEWLVDYRNTLREDGFSEGVLERAFSGLQPLRNVLKKERNQPEFTVDFERYSGWFLTDEMVRDGRRLKREHAEELEAVAARYGVGPRYVLAIWGIESRYGRGGDQYPVLRSLATLAYGSRRSRYFDRQLRSLLRILEESPVEPDQLRGSWAGALGQPQFMPTSYRDYAVDFDGDGFADIWSTEGDVFASIAFYLVENGWKPGADWGRPLEPGSPEEAGGRVLRPDGEKGRAFRTGPNFDVLLRYNPSHHYALTVGLLADRIGPIEETHGGSRSPG